MADNFYKRALSKSRKAAPRKRPSRARDSEPAPVTDQDILELLNAIADALAGPRLTAHGQGFVRRSIKSPHPSSDTQHRENSTIFSPIIKCPPNDQVRANPSHESGAGRLD
jgi:hypothetical protein